ncbi:transcriptional regulator [Desulfuromonas versatilis]|uniref:Transcriptional regulator n=1 Tax=Desulfuromonas versatilis TaxID=2802975 RepID=A0ABM8HQP0_9BACT|nr:Rrf2 family transcriptional regulator [Desulfuromonas versatilis]BCR05362.1 transcriptional regulator [Desulfuromonas versatilis]
MRLSTKAQYAVRAMVSLHLYGEDEPVSIRDIAAREEISLTYLEQLFVKLRRGKIVTSVRGPGGGYLLARPASQIRVDQIIDSVEETLVPVSCMDNDGKCACSDQCITHTVWHGLGERIRGFLSSITLEDLTREARGRLGGEGA